MAKISIIGLVASVLTLVLIAVSIYVPWWQISLGTFAQVNFSPVNFNLSVFSNPISMPIVWAMNIASLLTLLSGGLILMIYSVKPDKSYSKKLLGFGYSKPLYAVIFFIVELVVVYFSVQAFAGFTFPMMGSGTLQIPQSITDQMTGGQATISMNYTAGFLWPFYMAIVAATLCVATRLYHKKLVTPPIAPITPMKPLSAPPPTA
jgi:hypothetical protein